MPDFPIVDTHLHIWDPRKIEYPWLAQVPTLAGTYEIEDYRRACGAVQVEQMVFVQCECVRERTHDEVAWVTASAQRDPRITGIVSWAPLEKGDGARPDLEKLRSNRLVKGIRRIIQFEADPNAFARQPDFVRGVQMLPEYGLSFDLCINHLHFPGAIDLVRQCPGTSFILDHIGKPDIKQQNLDPWRANIKTLAQFPNVWCKVSGLATEADPGNWKSGDFKPYLDHVFACFGFDRCIFGGDWPVVTLASELTRWIATLDEYLARHSPAERRKVFHDNAIVFYRL